MEAAGRREVEPTIGSGRWRRSRLFLDAAAAGGAIAFAAALLAAAGLYRDGPSAAAAFLAAVIAAGTAWGKAAFGHMFIEKAGEEAAALPSPSLAASRYASTALVCMAGLAAMYGIHLIIAKPNDVLSAEASAAACIRWLGIAGAAWVMLIGGNERVRRQFAACMLVTMAVLLGPASAAGWLGILPAPDGFVLLTQDIRLSASGARLSGYLQYPNAQGAWTAALLLWSCAVLASESAAKTLRLAAALLAGPLLLALLLSESRGAMLAFAIGACIGAMLLRGSQFALWAATMGWTFLGASAAYRLSVHGPAEVSPGIGGASAELASAQLAQALLALLCCSVGGAAGLLALRRRLLGGSLPKRRALVQSLALLALGTAALAAALLPVLSARIGGHYETALSRASMYGTAIRLWREAPLLGTGGDAWRRLAGERFGVNEVHSGVFDMLLDNGLAGITIAAIMLGALVAAIWRTGDRRAARIGIAPVAALLLHAAIDFDTSYGGWWLLLLALAAYGTSEGPGSSLSHSPT